MPQGPNVEQSAEGRSKAFRDRARMEAGRYGPDPWIFVRELLQNSRDAGARTVSFVVLDAQGIERVLCRDDGEGMSFEHARRYLFSLYASSKEDAKNQAGKFGVGFWSVLRFEPTAITIRSRPRVGLGWGLRLDGTLEHATQVDPPDSVGTEIMLDRPGGDGRLDHRVFDAVWQSARYLYTRDDPERALIVTVNERPANAEFTLPAPSAAFRRGSVRGVVGLGPAPRVELFSRGLRVRSAASLEDLLAPSGRHTARMRVRFPELPGGLAPQALLESDKLEVMLSRSDARDTRALSKLVRLGQQELERLIEHQLSHTRPLPWFQRLMSAARARVRESPLLRAALGTSTGLVVALGVGWMLWGRTPPTGRPSSRSGPASTVAESTLPEPQVYRDLGTRYRGPKVDVLSPGAAEPIPLTYAPDDQRLYFAALSFSALAVDGSPIHQPIAHDLGPYPTTVCAQNCIRVRLPIVAEQGGTRIPVPTGHRIASGSAKLDGDPVELRASAEGHPAIYSPVRRTGVLEFDVSRGPDPMPPPQPLMVGTLPAELRRIAQRLQTAPIERRVEQLLGEVRRRVRYDRSPLMAQRHAQAQAEGDGFVTRTLTLGAGDCDVQNGLLVALLHAAHVPARLAVGYVGREGTVHPWLHAWVEYRDARGDWHVSDASENSSNAGPGTLDLRTSPTLPPPRPDASVSGLPAGGVPEAPGPLTGTPRASELTTPRAQANSSTTFFGWLGLIERRSPWLVRIVPLLLLASMLWSWFAGRTRRAIKLDHRADLSKLLQGVLQQPAAFGNFSALFTRPLVPLSNGGAISLNRARELAALGRLYRSERRPRLARKAVRSGAAVIDVRVPEGRTVADSLGAIDLDQWARAIETSFADPLTDQVNAYVRMKGEDWGTRLIDQGSSEVVVLDLAPLGVDLPGIRGTRVVLIDRNCPWMAQAQAAFSQKPHEAMFSILDRVAERLDLPTRRRARLLSAGARQALLSTFSR